MTVAAGCLIEVRSVRQNSYVMLTYSSRVGSSTRSQRGVLARRLQDLDGAPDDLPLIPAQALERRGNAGSAIEYVQFDAVAVHQ